MRSLDRWLVRAQQPLLRKPLKVGARCSRPDPYMKGIKSSHAAKAGAMRSRSRQVSRSLFATSAVCYGSLRSWTLLRVIEVSPRAQLCSAAGLRDMVLLGERQRPGSTLSVGTADPPADRARRRDQFAGHVELGAAAPPLDSLAAQSASNSTSKPGELRAARLIGFTSPQAASPSRRLTALSRF